MFDNEIMMLFASLKIAIVPSYSGFVPRFQYKLYLHLFHACFVGNVASASKTEDFMVFLEFV